MRHDRQTMAGCIHDSVIVRKQPATSISLSCQALTPNYRGLDKHKRSLLGTQLTTLVILLLRRICSLSILRRNLSVRTFSLWPTLRLAIRDMSIQRNPLFTLYSLSHPKRLLVPSNVRL